MTLSGKKNPLIVIFLQDICLDLETQINLRKVFANLEQNWDSGSMTVALSRAYKPARRSACRLCFRAALAPFLLAHLYFPLSLEEPNEITKQFKPTPWLRPS